MSSPQSARSAIAAWPGVEDAVLDLEGRPVRLLRATNPGNGEPTLLVHGLAGSSSTWVEVIEGLAAQTGGPVVALDLPGFGRTPPLPAERLTVGGYVRMVGQVADALGWDRLALHGNSMGGLVSTLFAARHPERVTGLVLVSPAFPPRVAIGIAMPSRATIGGMGPIAMSSFAATALAPVGLGAAAGRRRDERLLQIIYPSRAAANPDVLSLMSEDISHDAIPPDLRRAAVLSATRSIARHWTNPRVVWAAIDAVQAPTMLVGGSLDPLIPARVLRAAMARRRDWTGHLLVGRRHALMLEEPETYLDLVRDWARSASAA